MDSTYVSNVLYGLICCAASTKSGYWPQVLGIERGGLT